MSGPKKGFTAMSAPRTIPVTGQTNCLELLGANTMRSAWPIRGKNRAFTIIVKQRNKTGRTGTRAIQLAGSAVESPLGLDLLLLFLSSLSALVAFLGNCFRPKSSIV